MNQFAVDLGKVTALFVLTAGLVFCSLNAKAEEQQMAAVTPALKAAESCLVK